MDEYLQVSESLRCIRAETESLVQLCARLQDMLSTAEEERDEARYAARWFYRFWLPDQDFESMPWEGVVEDRWPWLEEE